MIVNIFVFIIIYCFLLKLVIYYVIIELYGLVFSFAILNIMGFIVINIIVIIIVIEEID